MKVTVVDPADVELAADALLSAGATAVEERQVAGTGGAIRAGGAVVLVAGAGVGQDPRRLVEAVTGRWPAEVVAVDVGTALDAWRDHARVVVAGRRLVVRPPWLAGAGGLVGRREVLIDPGRAFGSGSHASTRLALAALDGLVRGGETVLDVGCGSGVLAIAALVLGAGSAVAVDIGPEAATTAGANAERNGVSDRLEVRCGPLDEVVGRGGPGVPQQFDLVVANLLPAELEAMAGVVSRAVAPDGALVVSGFLAGQRARLSAAFPGLVPVADALDDGWVTLTLRAG